MRNWMLASLFGFLAFAAVQDLSAQNQNSQINQFYHYPYYYFPHNYWPQQSPRWPEPLGSPYQPPPAYQAYPPYQDPNWRYEISRPQKYYRGNHFWLDSF